MSYLFLWNIKHFITVFSVVLKVSGVLRRIENENFTLGLTKQNRKRSFAFSC